MARQDKHFLNASSIATDHNCPVNRRPLLASADTKARLKKGAFINKPEEWWPMHIGGDHVNSRTNPHHGKKYIRRKWPNQTGGDVKPGRGGQLSLAADKSGGL